MSNPVTLSFSLATANASGVSLAQSLAGAANLTINGAFASTISSGTIATLTPARRLAITSAANDSALSWFIIGTDRNGNAQNETISGVSSTSSYTVYDYGTITRISASSATAGNVSAGTTSVGSTAWYPKEFNSFGYLNVYANLGSGVTGSFEITPDDVNANLQVYPYGASVNPQSNVPPVPWPADNLTLIAQSTRSVVQNSCMYWRWTTYGGTTSSVIQVIETVPYGQQNAF